MAATPVEISLMVTGLPSDRMYARIASRTTRGCLTTAVGKRTEGGNCDKLSCGR
jgi:hypothetical protein